MTEERGRQNIVVYPDREKLLKANGTTFLLGGVLAFLALAPWLRATVATRILAILSRASLLVWGWFCFPALFRLLFPKPIVTIDDNGIAYQPSRIGPFGFHGSLAWGEIKSLYIGELTMNKRGRTNVRRFLCVLPRDVDAFLQSYPLLSRTALSLMMLQIHTPLVLPEAILPLSVDELLARIRTQYADIIQAYEIELREEYKGSLTAGGQ
jgi:hypothetical protein